MNIADFVLAWLNTAGRYFDIFGMLGLCLGFAAGSMPRRNLILMTSALCSICFGLHYLRLGALTGTAMCSISLLQSLVSVYCSRSDRRTVFIGPVFAASGLVAVWMTLTTWNGLPSAFAAIGVLFSTCARLQKDAQVMRVFFVGASCCWAGHNGLVGSPFALTCDVLTISGMLLALVRNASGRRIPAVVPLVDGGPPLAQPAH